MLIRQAESQTFFFKINTFTLIDVKQPEVLKQLSSRLFNGVEDRIRIDFTPY